MKPISHLLTPISCLLLLAATAAAPEPPTLRDLADQAYAPPTPGAVIPGRYTLHTHGPTLFRLDTATGQTWELTPTVLPNGNPSPSWTRTTESHFAALQMMRKLENSK